MFGHAWVDSLYDGRRGTDFDAWKKTLRPVAQARPISDTSEIDADTAAVLAAISSNNPEQPGGELWILSAVDGKKVATHSLPAAPAYDGLALAHRKVYVTLQDGSVVCLGED